MMASPSPALPTPLRSTLSTSSIYPIFENHSRISSLLQSPKTRLVFRSSIKPLTNTTSDQSDHDQPSINKFKLFRRNLLIGAFGSKMSEIPPAFGELLSTSTSKKTVELSEFPITLDSVIITVMVPRPKKCRTKEEKEEEEEVLAVQGIEFVGDEYVKFDVHVNDDEDDLSRPENSEFAGSFVYMPHRRKTVTTSLRLGITDLLDDLGADGDDCIKVTLVPKHVKRPVTIGKIKIEFLK